MLGSILKSSFGGLGAQVVQFLAIPFLARLYTPGDFAILALCLAGLLLFSSIAAFRYELAVMIPKGHQQASDLFWGAVCCVSAMAGLGGILLAMPCLRQFLGLGDMTAGQAGLLFGGGILLQGMLMLLSNWATRQGCFGMNASAQVVQAVTTVVFQILWMTLDGLGEWGLILGYVVGQGASLLVTVIGLQRSGDLPNWPSCAQAMLWVMREQYRFPLYGVPRTLCGYVRDRGSIVIMEQHAARTDIGGYAVVLRLVSFPVSLVAGAVRPVLYRSMAKEGIAANEDRINAIQRLLVLLATPWLAVVMVMADDLALLLLGRQWHGMGDMMRVLIWPCYALLFINWLDRIMDVGSRQRVAMWMEGSCAVLSVLALWLVLGSSGSMLLGIMAQAVVLVVYYVVLWIVYFRLSGFSIWRMANHVLCAVAIYVCILSLVWVGQLYLHGIGVWIVVLVVVGTFYVTVLGLLGDQLRVIGHKTNRAESVTS